MEHVTLGALLEQVSSKTPTPGGGAVAGAVSALGIALGQMVVSYSLGKKSLAAHEGMLLESMRELVGLRDRCLRLGDEDARAYERLNALQRLRPDDPERAMQYGPAVEAAIAAPMEVGECCGRAMEVLSGLAGASNPHLKSDLAIAGVLVLAGAEAARWNVGINLREVGDEGRRQEYLARIDGIVGECTRRKMELDRACA